MPRRPHCGKLCLSEREAKCICLAAAYFRHDARRNERSFYFCRHCKAWHTTSQEQQHA